jgi:pimeloyl-ACP methyl ester carboxylesterase
MALKPCRGRRQVVQGRPERQRCFYSGTPAHPIFVDALSAQGGVPAKPPVIMIHGGCHTGACYLSTPDDRPGWAPIFAAAGHEVFAPDWPGHGRSPMRPDFATLSTLEIAQSLLALAAEVGPSILVVHSASGPMAWWMAEQRPDLICAVIGLAPGPPANILPVLPEDPAAVNALCEDHSLGCPICVPEDRPIWVEPAFMSAYWANGDRFPKAAFERYRRGVTPESARLLNERFNIGGRGLRIADPQALAGSPILIVTGDQDPRHPRAIDKATAEYLSADFVWLPDLGISGNGHMLMIENNNHEIAALALDWLRSKGF